MSRTIHGELHSFATIRGGRRAKGTNRDAGTVASRTSSKTLRTSVLYLSFTPLVAARIGDGGERGL